MKRISVQAAGSNWLQGSCAGALFALRLATEYVRAESAIKNIGARFEDGAFGHAPHTAC